MGFKRGGSPSVLPIIFILIVVLITIWIVYIKIPNNRQGAIERGEICGDFVSIDGEYDCCIDCEKLELEYFKYEFSSSMFGSSIINCYCEKNNIVTQVW